MINERFQNNYDFLRIFAATCICFTHSFNLIGRDAFEPMMRLSGGRFDFSFLGLSIFFSISGYLITKSVYTSSSLPGYFWKRFLRIQPLLIVVCILTVFILGPVFTVLPAHEYFTTPGTWTYFRNIFPATGIQFRLPGVFSSNVYNTGVNGSLWTLIVEERLYLAVSVFFFFKKSMKLFAFMMLMVNILFVLKGFLFQGTIAQYLDGSHVFYAMIFLNAGVMYQLAISFKALLRNKITLLTLPILAVCLALPFLASLLVIVIPFCIILLGQVSAATNRAGRWGDFTYGIYIFAFPIQQTLIACHLFVQSPYSLFLATMGIVLPLSALSWHLLEKRCLSYKKLVP